jgi:Ty3 transposon capsid-like protein/Zinc knuckle
MGPPSEIRSLRATSVPLSNATAGPSNRPQPPVQSPPPPDGNPSEPDDNPDPNPPNSDDDADNDNDDNNVGTADIVSALRDLAKGRKDSNKTLVREPDTFDGSDPRKLQSFLVQCRLNFNDQPNLFRSDRKKVNYVLSHLRGTALQWFEADIIADEEPEYFSRYDLFLRELRTNFGPHDPVGDAEDEIDNLRMKESHKVTKYNVTFNQLAAVVGWDDRSLFRQYYKGLPDRIKDELIRFPVEARTLRELREQAQTVDTRYWKRKTEQGRNNPAKPQSSDKSPNKSGNNNNNSNNSGKKPEKKSPNQPQNSASSGSKSSDSNPPPNPKLGKDGKLTQEERTRRFQNNLCMFCGQPGHTAKECPKSTSKAVKARAAKASEPGDNSGSKKA